jgi:MFS family permease
MTQTGDTAATKRTPFFYGYVIVAASFFIIFIMHGMQSSYGVYFSSLQTEFGWSRATLSAANSLAFVLAGGFTIMAGRLTDKLGPKVVMTTSGLIMGLGYLLTSRVDTVFQLFLFYGVIIGISDSSVNVTQLSTTVRWFTKRRGMMSGIVKVGTGAGMFIMPLVAGWFITAHGWRNAYLVLGLIAMVSVILVAQLLKRDPAQMGLKPYGAEEVNAESVELAGKGLSFREALRTRQLWTICIIYFIAWYMGMTNSVHIVAHAIDLGISSFQAAGVLSTIGGISIIGRVVMGSAGDHLGNRRALGISFVVIIIPLFLLQFAGEIWALYLYAAVYGFGHGGFFALVSPLVAEIFGTISHGSILGGVLFLGQMGGAVGPAVTGLIFDVTGSYRLAFMIMLALSVVGFTFSILLKPIKQRSGKEAMSSSM